MRAWIESRRSLILAGAVIVLAAVIGVAWGVADAGRTEASEATTTSVVAEATTMSAPGTTSLGDSGSSTTTTEATVTTTTSRTSSGDDSSAPHLTTPPPNQPPVIEDPGISSDGMKLTLFPVISDPENDPFEVSMELNGNPMKGDGTSPVTITRNPAHPDVGYVNEVTIGIRVTDTAGNEVFETFDHVLRAISTVTLRDLTFTVGSADCFEEEAAQRITANIQLRGVIDEVVNESEEIRSDRSSVTLLEEISSDVVGEKPGQTIKVIGGLHGLLDAYEGSHAESDDVLITLFASETCEGFLSYEIEVSSR